MQSVKVEPRCVTIVSSASSTLEQADAVVESSGGTVGRWRRTGSLSCNGDLCPVVISSPYCKRSNTTTALCSVVSAHDYDINENGNRQAPYHRQHIHHQPTASVIPPQLDQYHHLADTLATPKNTETLRVRPPSAPPSYHSLISLAGLDCIDYPDYHFDNLDHPGPIPEVDFVDQVQIDCPTAGPVAGGARGSLDYSANTKSGRSSVGTGGHQRHPPRDGYNIPSAQGSPSLRATARMMRKHYR